MDGIFSPTGLTPEAWGTQPHGTGSGRESPTTSTGSKGKRPRSDSMDPDGQFGVSPPVSGNAFSDLTTLWETTQDGAPPADNAVPGDLSNWLDGIADTGFLSAEPAAVTGHGGGASNMGMAEAYDFISQILGPGGVATDEDPETALENHPGLPDVQVHHVQESGLYVGSGHKSRPIETGGKGQGRGEACNHHVVDGQGQVYEDNRLPPSLAGQARMFINHSRVTEEARLLSNRLSQSAQPIRRHQAVMSNNWMSDVIQPPPLSKGDHRHVSGMMLQPPPIPKQRSTDVLANAADALNDPSVINFAASMFGVDGVGGFDEQELGSLWAGLRTEHDLSQNLDRSDPNTTWSPSMKLTSGSNDGNVKTVRSHSTTRPPPSSRQKLSPMGPEKGQHQRNGSGGHQRTPSGNMIQPNIMVQSQRRGSAQAAGSNVGPIRAQNLPASEDAHPYRFVENAKVKVDIRVNSAINLKMGPGQAVVPTLSAAEEEELRSRTISFQELSKYFHLPINDASRELGVCTTVLKKVCRRHGINRWPQRKIKSLNRCIEALESMIAQPGQTEKEKTRLQKKVGKLIQKRQLLIDNPNAKVNLRSNIKLNPTANAEAGVKEEDDGDDDDDDEDEEADEKEGGKKNMSVEAIGIKNPPSPELLAAIRAKQGSASPKSDFKLASIKSEPES